MIRAMCIFALGIATLGGVVAAQTPQADGDDAYGDIQETDPIALAQITLPGQGTVFPILTIDDLIFDPAVRRTDPVDGFNPIPIGQNLPDLIGLSMHGWNTPTPETNPYAGSIRTDGGASLLRIDLVFRGLVNPPGSLGVGIVPFDPYLFGANPIFGFVEIDVDADLNTGGELGTTAQSRYLANAARFGGLPAGPRRFRTAIDGDDLDLDFQTPPFLERSGCDWVISFCGCETWTIERSLADNPPLNEFNEGDDWVLRGRAFHRAEGYQLGSGITGGSAFGLYDPPTLIRFRHLPESGPMMPGQISTDITLVTIVYPLTMLGAAQLTGEPVQPPNFSAADHTSIAEGLADLVFGADDGALTGPNQVLQQGWAGRDPMAFLRPEDWSAVAIVGVSFPDARPFLYIWTDVGFNQQRGDVNGDGQANSQDQNMIAGYIDVHDAFSAQDCDNEDGPNLSVKICNFGVNFVLYDVNGDGFVDHQDVNDLAFPVPGDVNGDRVVDILDLNAVLGNFGTVNGGNAGDADGDGDVDINDLNVVLGNFGLGL